MIAIENTCTKCGAELNAIADESNREEVRSVRRAVQDRSAAHRAECAGSTVRRREYPCDSRGWPTVQHAARTLSRPVSEVLNVDFSVATQRWIAETIDGPIPFDPASVPASPPNGANAGSTRRYICDGCGGGAERKSLGAIGPRECHVCKQIRSDVSIA